MPQLQINQGPQDALLYDNQRSYFTNVGYVRTSNFQVEYRNVDAQNTPTWGGTAQYIIPKAADLLGPVDLRVTIPAVDASGSGITNQGVDGSGTVTSATGATTRLFSQWVDELGFAMLEKVTFSVGSNDIETLTGEQLQIRNELMTSDEMRLGYGTIQKTGRAAFAGATGSTSATGELPGMAGGDAKQGAGPDAKGKGGNVNADYTRLIEVQDGTSYYRAGDRHLIIPLGLFFTKHVSQYFPLAAVAGCNDIRISIKFRPLNELMQMAGGIGARTGSGTTGTPYVNGSTTKIKLPKVDNPTAQLFCHYVHVTGPEAQQLMNKEHVRLLKLFQHQPETITNISGNKMEMNLSFLHPVSTLIITVRATDDLNSNTPAEVSGADGATKVAIGRDSASSYDTTEFDCMGKGHFFYHGDGSNPNYDRSLLDIETNTSSVAGGDGQGTVKVKSIALTLNGQERHPGLDKGLDVDYIRERLMPMLHSNSNQVQKQLHSVYGVSSAGMTAQNYGMQGSKNIFVYPFSLNPEGSNPSGAVNFSKVSHAKLTMHLDTGAGPLALSSNMPAEVSGFRVDVYALYYNWLQIKDGRALLSFA